MSSLKTKLTAGSIIGLNELDMNMLHFFSGDFTMKLQKRLCFYLCYVYLIQSNPKLPKYIKSRSQTDFNNKEKS